MDQRLASLTAAAGVLHPSSVRVQASGEAVYTSDVGVGGGELYAAIVPSTQALAYVASLDPSPALALPGVVAFVGPQDIPERGRNAYQSGSGLNSVRSLCWGPSCPDASLLALVALWRDNLLPGSASPLLAGTDPSEAAHAAPCTLASACGQAEVRCTRHGWLQGCLCTCRHWQLLLQGSPLYIQQWAPRRSALHHLLLLGAGLCGAQGGVRVPAAGHHCGRDPCPGSQGSLPGRSAVQPFCCTLPLSCTVPVSLYREAVAAPGSFGHVLSTCQCNKAVHFPAVHTRCKRSLEPGQQHPWPPNSSWLLQELGEPILSLDQGIKAGSYVQENGRPVQILRSTGDVSAGLHAAPHTITNARHVQLGCSSAAWALAACCSPYTLACLLYQ